MNIPNLITIFRMILIPIYALIFFSDLDNRVFLAGMVFLLAGISDVLDGYLARKYNQTTKLGTVLDPLADKLMSFTVLFTFALDKIIPYGVLFLLIAKEGSQIIGGLILYFKKDQSVIPSNKFGKVATILFYIFVFSVMAKLPYNISFALLMVTVALNILAFMSYLKIYLNMTGANGSDRVDK